MTRHNTTPTAQQVYEQHGWSGCDGSHWRNLTQATREGWDFAARIIGAPHTYTGKLSEDEVGRLTSAAYHAFGTHAVGKFEGEFRVRIAAAVQRIKADAYNAGLAARGNNTTHEADWDAITETIASDSAKRAGWEPNDYDSDDPVTWDLAFRLPAKRAVEITRAALSPAPTNEDEGWECGPHANAWGGHDARCRKIASPATTKEEA